MYTTRYIHFFTGFAFDRLFGSEMGKNIQLDFLNALLYEELEQGQGRIVSFTYLTNEQMGRSEYDRRAVYDLYCENARGENFIVEIQHP